MSIPFHSTGYGRKFYEGQLPRLIEALSLMAVAADRKTVFVNCKDCAFCVEHKPVVRDGLTRTVFRCQRYALSGKTMWPEVNPNSPTVGCGEGAKRSDHV